MTTNNNGGFDISQFLQKPVLHELPSGTLTTAMGFYEVPDFTIQVHKGVPRLTCKVFEEEYECELAGLASYPTMLYAYRIGKKEFKGLPIVHSTPNMHYLAWHLANISFKVVATAEATGLDVDIARLEFNRIYKVCVGWGASLVSDKRLTEAKRLMASGQSPYKASRLIAKMFGVEAIHQRISLSLERLPDDGTFLDVFEDIERDGGGIDYAVKTLLQQQDQLQFKFDDVDEISF